jgi:hypothetical protein
MQGNILTYSAQTRTGIITSDTGDRFSFSASDWEAEVHPMQGQDVDFVASPEGKANNIYLKAKAVPANEGMSGAMKKALIALGCAIAAFFIPVIGLILSIAGIIVGRQARAAAVVDQDSTAGTVATVAIVVGIISLMVAAFIIFTLMFGGMMIF